MMQNQATVQDQLPPPEQAIQQLNEHIKSFQESYPQYATVPQQALSPLMDNSQHSMQMACMTPNMVARPITPTNAYLPTPPQTNKAMRVMRHVDMTPFSATQNLPIVQIDQSGTQDSQLFHDPFGGSDYGCTSSYQSSLVDPMSPSHSPIKGVSMRTMSMPTLFEENASNGASPLLSQDQLLYAAASGQFNGYMADSPMRAPLSPGEMLLQGIEGDASIEDTGISAEEVAGYIGEQDAADNKWTCLFPECNRKFGRKENIKSHIQTHLGDRQFRCNSCGKCFVRQHDLKRHVKIHSGDKPHRCPCGNGFARQDALTRHRQRGVCEGALPGFERREVKRGRPRKSRPDMIDRVEKSTRARHIDARRGSEATSYNSSSSCGSVRSDPFTPPNMCDSYDAESMAQLNDPNGDIDALIRGYEDTPPTSPMTAGSPSKFNGLNSTASIDFASNTMSPHAASHYSSPSMYGGASNNPSPSLVSYHSPQSKGPVMQRAATVSQSETFSSSVFDWGAIDAQPSLSADNAFSPASSASEMDGSTTTYQNMYEQHRAEAKQREGDLYTPSLEQLLGIEDGPSQYDQEYVNGQSYTDRLLEQWLGVN